jgi:hypothetical protein
MGGDTKRRITLELSLSRLAQIDALKKEWGIRNRGEALERLLDDLFNPGEGDEEPSEAVVGADAGERVDPGDREELDEQTALVLVSRSSIDLIASDFELEPDPEPAPRGRSSSSGGIDLPGFVRRNSDQIRRSLRQPRATPASMALPKLSTELVQQALGEARDHWLSLYGKVANATVLEAAMLWLGQDIWPQSDASEGRRFTWSGACVVMRELVPDWGEASPNFERVMVTAGVLEDPFSPDTLTLRIPTLIRRFVHRFRNRRRGTSFQTLEHTMTLQGAMKLLDLPTDPGRKVSLAQIREAYREMALRHHPDSGGSLEAMRRINEAYQLLKELYRPQANPAPEAPE